MAASPYGMAQGMFMPPQMMMNPGVNPYYAPMMQSPTPTFGETSLKEKVPRVKIQVNVDKTDRLNTTCDQCIPVFKYP